MWFPDSLYWSEAAYRALPTAFRNPVAQKTVASTWTGQVYCLTTDGADYNMSVSPNPYKAIGMTARLILERMPMSPHSLTPRACSISLPTTGTLGIHQPL